MLSPPVLVPGCHEIVAWSSPATAVALSGALGEEGTTDAADADEAGDAPAALVATTLKV